MPPKKRLGKEHPAEGSSQAAEEQVPTAAQTLYLQPPTNLHTVASNPTEQPTTQTKVLTLNTSAPNIVPLSPHQHQTIETQEDLQQDSEEKIEAIIKDELAHLHQENECMCLVQEYLARRKVMTKRSQVMQQ
jgi:hypothetical protein